MSQENVALLKRIYAGWAKGNFAVGNAAYDENILVVVRPDLADPGRFRGVEEVRNFMRAWLDAWENFAIEGNDFKEVGDSVLVRVVQRGVGRVSGLSGELAYYQVWTLRGGKVIRLELILDEKDALQAVGLSEQDAHADS
jgi:ketosteroid isomerase-like protein